MPKGESPEAYNESLRGLFDKICKVNPRLLDGMPHFLSEFMPIGRILAGLSIEDFRQAFKLAREEGLVSEENAEGKIIINNAAAYRKRLGLPSERNPIK